MEFSIFLNTRCRDLRDTNEKQLFLISHGADVNAINNRGWTPLHLTCVLGHKSQAELLIAADADVNAKDKDGHTPLWYAQELGHTELAELLRKHGAKEKLPQTGTVDQ